jgi:general secretion pathway protein D
MALTVGMDTGLAASPQQREGRAARNSAPYSAPERTLARMTEDAPAAKPKFAGAPARSASSQEAMKLLKEARIALMVGEPEAAMQLAEKAERSGTDFANSVDSPKKVKALIGQFEKLSEQSGSPAELKMADAKFYMAQADGLLLHRDFAGAEKMARSAAKLKAKFTSNDRTPEMLLQYISEERRAVIATSGQAKKYDVEKGVYNPERDTTRNERASAQEPAEEEGLALYDRGLEALEKGDRAAALDLFLKAFAHRKTLEPEVQQDLGDKIVGLRRDLGASADKSQLEDISSKENLAAEKVINDWHNVRTSAEKLVNTDPNAAISKLESFRDSVGQAEINNAVRQRLLTFVDRELVSIRSFIESNRPEIELNAKNKEVLDAVEDRRERSLEVDEKIAMLVDQFNMLVDERRYPEAEIVAKQANELAPDNETVRVMLKNSQFISRFRRGEQIGADKEDAIVGTFLDLDRAAIPFGDETNPLKMPDARTWEQSQKYRGKSDSEGRLSKEDQLIYTALGQRVEMKFSDKPLGEVLEMLSQTTNINIFTDPAGLVEEGIQSSEPVSLNLRQPVSMRSALRLILDPLGLDFTVKNETLVITSKRLTQNSLTTVVYDVADLVIPIPNFIPNSNQSLQDAIRNGIHTLGYGGVWRPLGSGPVTVSPADAMAKNQPYGGEANSALDGVQGAYLAQHGMSGSLPSATMSRPTKFTGYEQFNQGGGAMADFQSLISLITLTIDPDSWLQNGEGSGEIQPFFTNLTLVISQTQEVHEKIADLLKQLRRLQDLQITIEVRFISLSDNFFERIGVDFDVSLEDGQPGTGFNANQDVFKPGRVVGLAPDGAFSPNLDVNFRQGGFGSAVPAFGGFDPATAANFGFAILSDIEVYFLLQAAQGDTRTNVLQAPKVTLFNGQSAQVIDVLQRPFVTGIIPVVGDFAAAHQPVVVVLNEGTSMHVQAVVNSDRKYVRMTLVPSFTRIGDVETFTFSGRTTTSGGTVKVDPTDPNSTVTDGGSTTTEGTTVQLPQQIQTSVNTTVSVPDGGTILLGGVKRSREARNERGVPLLSKVPYVNRLFRNVAIGRETSSLMMMVTPRIIIQEEEITKLTGQGGTP